MGTIEKYGFPHSHGPIIFLLFLNFNVLYPHPTPPISFTLLSFIGFLSWIFLPVPTSDFYTLLYYITTKKYFLKERLRAFETTLINDGAWGNNSFLLGPLFRSTLPKKQRLLLSALHLRSLKYASEKMKK